MNNSDHNDFINWQNGDENEMNNPNNWMPKNGFFYYGNSSDAFKKIWESMYNNENPIEYMKEYFNMDDFAKKMENNKNPKRRPNHQKPQSKPEQKVIFTHEDYNKLIEIRGYLAITEQMSHVKALDKLLSQIVLVNKDQR